MLGQNVSVNSNVNYEDVLEFLLAGASLVQIGTMNYQNPNIGPQLADELSNYLDLMKITNLHDLIGKVKYHAK